MSTSSLEPRVYEVGYHILPIVAEVDLDAEVSLIRSLINKVNGEVIKEGAPRLLDLAYSMSKVIDNKRSEFDKAYFGWIKFTASPDNIASIKKSLEENRNILRFILISTVKEDTVVGDIPSAKEDKKSDAVLQAEEKTESAPSEESVPVDEEKLNEQLDEIVGEEE